MRRLLAILFGGALLLSIAAPVGAKEFGTIYIDGELYRTFGNSANVPAGTGTDPLVMITNFEQAGVAAFAPGEGSHGGRWQVWRATWDAEATPRLLTSYGAVVGEFEAGNLTLVRVPEADFRCPVLPGDGG